EWVAHTLWSAPRQSSLKKAPATRLTQTRRREAKGFSSQALGTSALPNRTCIPGWRSSEPSRLDRFDLIAQSRRAESQSRQATAKKSWNPTENPPWLDEKFYYEQIQPRLLALQAQRIRSAISVSLSYASRIRSGKSVPHPSLDYSRICW